MNKSTGSFGNQKDPADQGADTLVEPAGRSGQLSGLAKLTVPPEIIRTLPAEFVKRHCLLPFAITNGTIHIATAAPGNQRVIDDIRLLSGLEVEEFAAPGAEITAKISECYQVTVEKMIENLDPAKAEGEVKD